MSLISLKFNGGWNSIAFEKQIVNLSNKYNMRMIASLQFAKACQVGLCNKVRKFCCFSEGSRNLEDATRKYKTSHRHFIVKKKWAKN